MLKAREFRFDDLKNIEMNEIAKKNVLDIICICMLLNDIEAETLVDEDGCIHVIGVFGDIQKTNEKYLFGIYSKDCSFLAVRFIKKWIAEKKRNGYNFMTFSNNEELKKLHCILFSGDCHGNGPCIVGGNRRNISGGWYGSIDSSRADATKEPKTRI